MPYVEFWNASADAYSDIQTSLDFVYTRNTKLQLEKSLPPEEYLTYNLIRRLAESHAQIGGAAVALHNRALEGGNKSSRRPPSGCDIEMAIEVAPGKWLDLALQAKKYSPATSNYKGWSKVQNGNLIRWANKNGGRTPGMLLYNSTDSPFCKVGRKTNIFGGCSVPTSKECTGDKKLPLCLNNVVRSNNIPPYPQDSPMAIGISLDQTMMKNKEDAAPVNIQKSLLPIECLFCGNWQGRSAALLKSRTPIWADELIEMASGRVVSGLFRFRSA
ncbi:hypothetical protein I6I64_00015 [Corynebacterium amycolatum]|uniref:hypothetical protein n=1 Tax=Corynebacterium amycolatum TaxID=43765 RepID=UPI00191F15E3|nr:hypothetical protein [Corynebacterium amycolatum]QQU99973.1 hypothetical protein I6I64_00015 [Corynebacterium amycolatum]